MSQIKQLSPKEGVTLLAYLLPKVEYSFIRVERWGQGNFLFGRPKYIGEINLNEQLPEGNWQLLGTPEQITEEVWQTLLPTFVCAPFRNRYINFLDIEGDLLTSATKSGTSFLQANELYSKNPLAGIFMPRPTERQEKDLGSVLGDVMYQDLRDRFLEAEANTGTWVILQRV